MAADAGGILAEPITDTVKQASEDSRILRTLDRSTLWRAQTPQLFPIGPLMLHLGAALETGSPPTDEAEAMFGKKPAVEIKEKMKMAENVDKLLARFSPTEITFDDKLVTAEYRTTLKKLVQAAQILDKLFLEQAHALLRTALSHQGYLLVDYLYRKLDRRKVGKPMRFPRSSVARFVVERTQWNRLTRNSRK